MSKFNSIEEMVDWFRKQHDYYFFDKSTMEFWHSRIESELIKGKYFITSEKAGFGHIEKVGRKFTIRKVVEEPRTMIEDVGDFNEWNTLSEAMFELNEHLELNKKGKIKAGDNDEA